MAKCGVCGMDTDKNPCITEDGKCTLCNQKLDMKKQASK